jgi:ABC-type multidrug transport system fused ATPase/permease subunit
MFRNMMMSEVALFDMTAVGGLLTLISEDCEMVRDCFGSTKGSQIMQVAQFLAGFVMVYLYSWKLGLVATCYLPWAMIIMNRFAMVLDKYVMRKFHYVAGSMTIAEETLAAVRIVRGFNRERRETKRFMNQVKKTETQDRWLGVFAVTMFWVVATSMWVMIIGNVYWGATQVQTGDLASGDLFSVFGMLLFSSTALVMLQTSLQAEQKAVGSGGRMLNFTEHVPDVNFDGGLTISNFKGCIEFKNVSFKYPTREVYALKNVSFVIEPGQMGALVGHSDSGKSTCVQLLERFYDVTEGLILIDGHDIRTLDPRWLHQKAALVSQEPILFQMTVAENIMYGKRDATRAEVEHAAQIANAHRFISKLEQGYNQIVGEKGSTLSGGQRQRVAIARAVIRDPVILITDEATSALDAASEKKVQQALDVVMKGRTAVIVAHRLSTIRNSDIIYVFDAGEIKELGVHDELVAKKGWYYELVKRQLTAQDVGKLSDSSDGLKRGPKSPKKPPTKASKKIQPESESETTSTEDRPAPKAPAKKFTSKTPEKKLASKTRAKKPADKTAEKKAAEKAAEKKPAQKAVATKPVPKAPVKKPTKRKQVSESSESETSTETDESTTDSEEEDESESTESEESSESDESSESSQESSESSEESTETSS